MRNDGIFKGIFRGARKRGADLKGNARDILSIVLGVVAAMALIIAHVLG